MKPKNNILVIVLVPVRHMGGEEHLSHIHTVPYLAVSKYNIKKYYKYLSLWVTLNGLQSLSGLPVTLNGLPNRPIEWVSLSTVDLIFKINNYINKTS